MKVAVYPADSTGCGHHRLIWPAQELAKRGHDVSVVEPKDRKISLHVEGDAVRDIEIDTGVDVVVFQRITHAYLAQAVPILRARGVAVVIDVDDDLTSIHPSNPAFDRLHPRHVGKVVDGKRRMHSWRHLTDACRAATLVTVSTDALVPRYASHGRAAVLANYLADHYFIPWGDVRRQDVDLIGWPASLHSHPNDPDAVGNAVARHVDQGAKLRVFGASSGVAKAFGLRESPEATGAVQLMDWPRRMAELGIGIAPLADTSFNAAKSWLKPLELAACGVPWIGSPRAEYLRLHEMGCGLMADRPKDWYRALRALRSQPLLRHDVALSGREVAEKLRLRDHAWKWWQAWEDALKLERAGA